LVTYAPTNVVRGDGFDLNLTSGCCILNYPGGAAGRPIQLEKQLDAEEIQKFDALFGE
jgi:hypothetical protein